MNIKAAHLFILVVLTNGAIAFSQDSNAYLVTYQQLKANRINEVTLVVSNDSSLYSSSSRIIKRSISEGEGSNYYLTQSSKTNEINILKARKFNKIFFESIGKKSSFLTVDSLPTFEWNINYSKSKRINDFKVYSATTIFRGTKVEAWFTESIPVPFGPWKFSGLPGLILDVYVLDEPQRFRWTVKSLKLLQGKVIFNQLNFDNRIQSYRSLVELSEKGRRQDYDLMKSKLPRGSKIQKIESSRTGIEKIYEWETTDEKK